MTTTTPNMSLVLPDVSITAGPTWATLINAAQNLIDAHDHSTGKGVLITPSGINISSDLSFAQQNATNLRTARLYNNTSFTAGTNDKTCVYALNNELYFRDGSGNAVQITSLGAVNASASISSLTLKDSTFILQYASDITRQFRFDASAIPSSTTRVLSIPESGANDTLVSLAATQTLTNKTLTSPSITTPAITTASTYTNVVAPSTPASGKNALYFSSVDKQLHAKDDAGNDTLINGYTPLIKNYLQIWNNLNLNPVTNAQVNLTSNGTRNSNTQYWGTSAASIATTMTYNSSTPLRGSADLQMTFPAAAANTFVESPLFTLDPIDVNIAVVYIFFNGNFSTGGASAGDITVQVVRYNSSGVFQALITPTVTNVATGYANFSASFTPSATASDQYAIRWKNTTASARNLYITNVMSGPNPTLTSAGVSPATSTSAGTISRESSWTNFTPSLSAGWGTVSSSNGFYKILGDTMYIECSFTTGTIAGSAATMTIPGSYSLSSSKISRSTSSVASSPIIGQGTDATAGASRSFYVLASASTSTTLIYFGQPQTAATDHTIPSNGNQITGSTTFISFKCEIPLV